MAEADLRAFLVGVKNQFAAINPVFAEIKEDIVRPAIIGGSGLDDGSAGFLGEALETFNQHALAITASYPITQRDSPHFCRGFNHIRLTRRVNFDDANMGIEAASRQENRQHLRGAVRLKDQVAIFEGRQCGKIGYGEFEPESA